MGQSAEVLLTIKANSEDAQKKLEAFKKSLKEIEKAEKDQLGPLEGLAARAGLTAEQFTGLKTGALAAVAAIGAITGIAVGAAAGLFQLTKAAADYGSAIFDATQQTGASAEAISALKYAADTSGSSLEAITGSIAKFSTLLGQAQNGNEKATETLKQYGITATETDAALAQALQTIADMTDTTQQSAAAAALFKDRTGQILPVIKSFNGDLPGLIKKVKDLGIAMDDEAAQAADNFGDQLDTLTAQAQGVGRQFATELMPMMTAAMAAISQAFSDNKGAAAEWGKALINVIRGVSVIAQGFGVAMNQTFQVLTLGLVNNASSWITWGNVLRGVLAAVTFGASEALYALSAIGAASQGDKVGAGLGGGFNPSASVGNLPGGGGGGGGKGGGGGGGGGVARDFLAEAQKQVQVLVDAYKDGADQMEAINDQRLANNEISEVEHAKELARIRLASLEYERDQLKSVTELDSFKKASADKQLELINKIGSLDTQIATQRIKNATDIGKAEADALDKAAEELIAFDELREKFHQRELKRLEELQRKRQATSDSLKAERARIDPFNLGKEKKVGGGDAQWSVSGGGRFLEGIAGGLGLSPDVQNEMSTMQKLGESLSATFSQVASAVGDAVKSFVLFGSAGGSFRKFAAEVIASIAQMAVVQAIFEAAQGLAMLALAWFTSNPKYAKSAAGHFASAAAFGMIGGVAAIAGRAVAGNSFNDATGGSGSAANDPQNQRNNFTSGQFSFGDKMTAAADAFGEAAATLVGHVKGYKPGDVLGMAVEQNPNAISDTFVKGLENNHRLTGAVKRAVGDAR
jgi:hypothetical protein